MPSKFIPTAKPATAGSTPVVAGDTSNTYPKTAMLVRLLSGVGSGTIGAVPSPITTPAAATIGGGGEALAEYLEQPSGMPLNKTRIGLESALSAVPLSKIYGGGKVLANMVRGGLLAETGNIGRRKAITGDYLPHSKKEALSDVASTGLGAALGVPTAMAAFHAPPEAADSVEQAVTAATKGASGVFPPPAQSQASPRGGSVTVGGDFPRVVKPTEAAFKTSEEPPRIAEAKRAVRGQTISRESKIFDLDRGIKQAQDVSKVERAINDTDRKADNKLLQKEQTADLQNTKAQQTAANSVETLLPRLLKKATTQTVAPEVSDLDKGIAAAAAESKQNRGINAKTESTLKRQEDAADLQDLRAQQSAGQGIATNLPRLIKQGTRPALPAEVSDLNAGIQDAAAEAKQNRNTNAKVEAQGRKAEDRADYEEIRRQQELDDQQAAQNKIDALLNDPNVKPGEPVVTETASAKVPGGRQTLKQSFRRVEPEEGEGGGEGGDGLSDGTPSLPNGGKTYSVDQVASREHVASTIYASKKLAMRDAKFHNADDVVRIPGGYRVVFKDIEPPPTPPATPTPTPKGPTDGPGSSGAAKEMAPSLERDSIAFKTFKNKAEAAAIAKLTGGQVNQVGPRAYRIKFTEEAIPAAGDQPITPTPTIALPPPKVSMPRMPKAEPTSSEVVPGSDFDRGGLSPDEFRRYMELRPNGPNGIKRTPEMEAELSALIAKKNSKPVVAEVSDYTGGQPTHSIEAPVPDAAAAGDPLARFNALNEVAGQRKLTTSEQAEVEQLLGDLQKRGIDPINQEAAVSKGKEQEPAIPGLEDVTKTENPTPPVAKVPFPAGKVSGKTSLPAGEQPSLPGVPAEPKPDESNLFTKMAEPAPVEESKPAAESWGDLPEDEGEGNLPKIFKAMGWGEVPKEAPAWEPRGAAPIAKVPEEAAPRGEAEAPAAEPTSNDLKDMTPEQQTKALTDLVNKFKSQKGEVTMAALSRLGLGAAGAVTGATLDKDDPLTGALLGGTIGLFAPTAVRALIGHAQNNPNVSETTLKDIAAKAQDTVETAFRMMPDYQRFAMLTHPINLPINMWVGPWGSSVMASLEHALQLDPRGFKALSILLNPKEFPARWLKARTEAASLIANASERTEGQLGQAGPHWFRIATSAPGIGMTAGDVAARDILMQAGFSAEEARRITLTSEPYTAFGKGIAALKKGAQTEGGKKSWFWNMALPFYRTNVNQLEQGMERLPLGFGMLYQKYAKDVPDPIRAQLAQGALGTGVSALSFTLGTVVPTDDAKYVLKFINDFGGQYGTVASLSFAAGQAEQEGKSKIGAVTKRLVQRDMPMPSTDIIQNVAHDLEVMNGGKGDIKSPFVILPGMLDPSVPGSATALVGKYAEGNQPPQHGIAPLPRTAASSSRYIPTRKAN